MDCGGGARDGGAVGIHRHQPDDRGDHHRYGSDPMDKNRDTSKLLWRGLHAKVSPGRDDRNHGVNRVSLKFLRLGAFARAGGLAVVGFGASSARAVDWLGIHGKKIMLLYAAHTSWERLMI